MLKKEEQYPYFFGKVWALNNEYVSSKAIVYVIQDNTLYFFLQKTAILYNSCQDDGRVIVLKLIKEKCLLVL